MCHCKDAEKAPGLEKLIVHAVEEAIHLIGRGDIAVVQRLFGAFGREGDQRRVDTKAASGDVENGTRWSGLVTCC